VYVGTEVFQDAGLNVVIAIYLQAIVRLYEVVLINKDTAQEISRLYVYEKELTRQMKKRHVALTCALDTHSAWAVARATPIGLTTPHDISRSSSSSSREESASTPRRKSLGDIQTEPLEAARPSSSSATHTLGSLNHRRKSLVPVFTPHKHSNELNSSKSHSKSSDSRRKSIVELHHELLGHSNEVRVCLSSKHSSTDAILKELELAEILSGEGTLASAAMSFPITDPVSFFHLMAGSNRDPEVDSHFQKVERAQLLKDYALLDADISTSAVRNITFFTAAILNSLYVRYKEKQDEDPELQFLLFDGIFI
jgi:hypothetical protein